MDIVFYGANCVSIATKQARLVFDDNIAELGAKSATKSGDVVLFTGAHGSVGDEQVGILFDRPGEYEVAGVSIYGIEARAHMDDDDQKTATMYKLIIDDARILVIGHVYPELSEAQLEAIGMVDLMIVPVGGNGYTLDGTGALKLIKKIEPKVVIPTHYDDAQLQFPVPQQSLEQAIKLLAMEPKETTTKLKFTPAYAEAQTTQLVVLERS